MEKFLSYCKANYRELIFVSVITLFALFIRVIAIQNYGDLWLDELYSLYFSNQTSIFKVVSELLAQDLHMPLYFMILHIWIKIFGANDISFHTCSLFLSIPLIPIAYYLIKNIFNEFSGYVAAGLMAINTFCVYYSVEVRFYSLVLPLTLVSAVFFVKMLKKFNLKNSLWFAISQTFLIYTFSITPLLTFFYALVGLLYLVKYEKELLKKFLLVFSGIFVASVPAILITLYNFFVIKTSLISFQGGIYKFDWRIIFDIFENFFTTENFQIVTLQLNNYGNFLNNIFTAKYAFFVLTPIMLMLFGFTKALLAKNKNLYLFLLPSLLFLITLYIFASFGLVSFLTKYSIIIYPMIICAAAFGFSSLSKKYIGLILVIIVVLLNYFYLLTSTKSVLYLNRMDIGNLRVNLENLKVSQEDVFLIPYSGSRFECYLGDVNLVRFNADDFLLLKDKKSKMMYFGKNSAKVTKKNIRDYIYAQIYENSVSSEYEQNLYKYYLSNMHKGQKLVVILYRDFSAITLFQNWKMLKNKTVYDQIDTFSVAMAKISFDSLRIAEKYLKPVNAYRDDIRNYSIFIYEKQ